FFVFYLFFFSSRRRHTRSKRDWSSDVCSSDLEEIEVVDEFTIHIKTKGPFAALPSHLAHPAGGMVSPAVIEEDYAQEELLTAVRSEERRVGKESRTMWST